MPPTVAPQPLIPASECLMFEQNLESIGRIAIHWEDCTLEMTTTLTKK